MLHIGWRPQLPQETALFIGGAQIILLLLLYFPRPPLVARRRRIILLDLLPSSVRPNHMAEGQYLSHRTVNTHITGTDMTSHLELISRLSVLASKTANNTPILWPSFLVIPEAKESEGSAVVRKQRSGFNATFGPTALFSGDGDRHLLYVEGPPGRAIATPKDMGDMHY